MYSIGSECILLLAPAAVFQLAYHYHFPLSIVSWDSIFKMHLHSALINDIRIVFNVHRNRINILLAMVGISFFLTFNAYKQFHAHRLYVHILRALRFMRYINNSIQQVFGLENMRQVACLSFLIATVLIFEVWAISSDFLDGFLYCIRYLTQRSNLLKIFLQQWI